MDYYNVDKIMDGRTPFKAGRNYEISKYNEEVSIQGLSVVAGLGHGIEDVWYEKIDENEEWIDGKMHVKPDFFFYIRDVDGVVKKWTIEVKTTSYPTFLNEEIIIKAPQVWSCKNNIEEFPRPYILACTNREFALIPMGSFWNSPAEDIRFGDFVKKGYLLRCQDYEWRSFVSPLQFKTRNGFTSSQFQRD